MKQWICMVFLIMLLAVPAYTVPLRGEGTEEMPYRIASTEEYRTFAALVNSGDDSASGSYVLLENDIDFSSEAYISVGTINAPFYGTFDGDGYCIRGVSIQSTAELQGTERTSALFGTVENGCIMRLCLRDCRVSVEDTAYRSTLDAGILVGKALGAVTLDRCDVSDSCVSCHTSAKSCVGALIGSADGGSKQGSLTVVDCRAADVSLDVETSRFLFAGTLVGLADLSGDGAALSVRHAVSEGYIRADSTMYTYVGGVFGNVTYEPDWSNGASLSEGGNICGCYADLISESSGLELHQGDLCGYAIGVKAENCYAASPVKPTVGAIGASSVQTADRLFFADTLGFDTTIWQMTEALPRLFSKTPSRYYAAADENRIRIVAADDVNLCGDTMYAALYDENGRLVSFGMTDITGKEASVIIPSDGESDSVRIFFFGGLKPAACALSCRVRTE